MNKIAIAALLASVFAAQAQTASSWMSSDVGQAWASGYKGQGVTIQVVDQFRSNQTYLGTMTGSLARGTHGAWTATQAGMVAPLANVVATDFNQTKALSLASGLNVINASYGVMAAAGYKVNNLRWDPLQKSIMDYANSGKALVVKSAGNEGIAVGTANSQRAEDYLSKGLIGAKSAIIVGALSRNGSPDAQASMASYSNYAGNNAAVQNQFLVVGVESGKLGLAGTSFAAPVVSGYAAIVGSKFTSATPTQVASQLLDTARTDTIKDYSVNIHGRGEASLSRALAPRMIE